MLRGKVFLIVILVIGATFLLVISKKNGDSLIVIAATRSHAFAHVSLHFLALTIGEELWFVHGIPILSFKSASGPTSLIWIIQGSIKIN